MLPTLFRLCASRDTRVRSAAGEGIAAALSANRCRFSDLLCFQPLRRPLSSPLSRRLLCAPEAGLVYACRSLLARRRNQQRAFRAFIAAAKAAAAAYAPAEAEEGAAASGTQKGSQIPPALSPTAARALGAAASALILMLRRAVFSRCCARDGDRTSRG